MEIEEFFNILEQMKQASWTWEISPHSIGPLIRSRSPVPGCCPIIGVCLHQTGRKYRNDEVPQAAEELQISPEDTQLLVGAADDSYDLWGGEENSVIQARRIQQQLLTLATYENKSRN